MKHQIDARVDRPSAGRVETIFEALNNRTHDVEPSGERTRRTREDGFRGVASRGGRERADAARRGECK